VTICSLGESVVAMPQAVHELAAGGGPFISGPSTGMRHKRREGSEPSDCLLPLEVNNIFICDLASLVDGGKDDHFVVVQQVPLDICPL
jgi:hypothetical protein